MMTTPRINFYQVPESTIIEAADVLDKELEEINGQHEGNNFRILLNNGAIFKKAGLTPLYIVNDTFDQLQVLAKEYIGKKLH